MEKIAGGYQAIIVADNALFSDYHVLRSLLKRGTSVSTGTITEENSDNVMVSAMKTVNISIAAADHDDAIRSLVASAEEAHTKLYFRVFPLHPHYYLDVLSAEVVLREEPAEAGKLSAVRIDGISAGEKESDVLTLVYMFNPFNPENL